MNTRREPRTNRINDSDRRRSHFIKAFEELSPLDFKPEEWAAIQANLSVKANKYTTPDLPEP